MGIDQRLGEAGPCIWEIRGVARIKEGLTRRHRVHEPNGTKSVARRITSLRCATPQSGAAVYKNYSWRRKARDGRDYLTYIVAEPAVDNSAA